MSWTWDMTFSPSQKSSAMGREPRQAGGVRPVAAVAIYIPVPVG